MGTCNAGRNGHGFSLLEKGEGLCPDRRRFRLHHPAWKTGAGVGDPKQQYDLKSTTKSFGATALAVALKDNKIKLEDNAQKYHPTFGVPPESNRETGWLDDITILHLATQTAGFEKPGGYEKLLFEPGTQWYYSDGGPNWLAECLTLIYRQDLQEFMFERVFTPIGITKEDLPAMYQVN